jgi:SERTA motif
MMGLQAKRKRDDQDQELPALKCGRGLAWPSSPRPTPRLGPQRAPPLWALEEPDSPPDSDDEEDDDELMEELECRKVQTPYCYPSGAEAAPPSPAPFYRGGGGAPATPTSGEPYCPPGRFSRTYWPPQYCYQPPTPTPAPTPTQTIRCAENGKSYLELGSAASTVVKSRAATYRQQRLQVLNISMCKLSRFRQFPDPSLHRSVLICNTLRRIEREMEADSHEPPPPPPPPAAPYQQQPPVAYPATPPPQEVPFYEHNLRDLASPAPRLTPFPSPQHPGPDDASGSINWGSVLSLSSQSSDLDPLNNNGRLLLDELEPAGCWRIGADDSVLKSLERTTSAGVNGDELVDSLMQVLVGT